MAVFHLSRRAEADLIEISAYTLQTWGADQTIRYIDELETCCHRLAHNPGLGRACDEIRPGLRRMGQGKHVIFYRQHEGGILVSRILHHRMLPKKHAIDDTEA
ncbi:MAG TPA: type II toxin-antitoxin system RelE/ParE family toxin [Bryobacteraceae bacterium]|nr:type II toxin-antitoxin system RelE/ParE family toxin [Bryobacteraceae bacterium]